MYEYLRMAIGSAGARLHIGEAHVPFSSDSAHMFKRRLAWEPLECVAVAAAGNRNLCFYDICNVLQLWM